MNVKEAEQLIGTKEQTNKQLTHEEIIRKMTFHLSLTLTLFMLQLMLPSLLTNLTKGPVSLGVDNNGNELSIDGAGLQKIKELTANVSSICLVLLLLIAVFSTARYGYMLVRDSALVEVPISNEDSKGKIETVKIETRKKAVTGIRYKCEYCGREYLLTKHFNGFVPNCKSCGAVLEKKENFKLEN